MGAPSPTRTRRYKTRCSVYIQPAAGDTYRVSGPLRSQTVGPAATAQEAIAMVVRRLPAGCGPAFLGNPEELAAQKPHWSGTRPTKVK
ncbi:DUF6193 family natural product biosynthesis protein [Streptomyces javensis]|uniref:DUF6193 family natural product biosynthesis protein n=1 Tax=Streptomyces javensis TaxID=114698 RepID=UPI0033E9C114